MHMVAVTLLRLRVADDPCPLAIHRALPDLSVNGEAAFIEVDLSPSHPDDLTAGSAGRRAGMPRKRPTTPLGSAEPGGEPHRGRIDARPSTFKSQHAARRRHPVRRRKDPRPACLGTYAPTASDRHREVLIARDEDAQIVAMMDGIPLVQERALTDADREALRVVRDAFLAEARRARP